MSYAVALGLASLYLYCYFGKITTDNYSNFANEMYKSNWIILPIELQKLFVLMISHGQIPVVYHGYNVVNLDLVLFTKVKNSLIFLHFQYEV